MNLQGRASNNIPRCLEPTSNRWILRGIAERWILYRHTRATLQFIKTVPSALLNRSIAADGHWWIIPLSVKISMCASISGHYGVALCKGASDISLKASGTTLAGYGVVPLVYIWSPRPVQLRPSTHAICYYLRKGTRCLQ